RLRPGCETAVSYTTSAQTRGLEPFLAGSPKVLAGVGMECRLSVPGGPWKEPGAGIKLGPGSVLACLRDRLYTPSIQPTSSQVSRGCMACRWLGDGAGESACDKWQSSCLVCDL
ncbi:unnamed protein product, partial [Scytosiphon promiscuus]